MFEHLEMIDCFSPSPCERVSENATLTLIGTDFQSSPTVYYIDWRA